jgi:hypothetical protein
VDTHSFTAGADYRVYAATLTGFSGGSPYTLRDVVASNATTVPWTDNEEGRIGSVSNIAGTLLATAGSYYVRVRQFKKTSLPWTIRPYDFYARVLSGSPIPKLELNDKGASQAPRPEDWVSRVIGKTTAKNDSFTVTVNGGDMIVAIVGVDLERGTPEWNVIGGTGVFTGSFIMINGGRNLL